MICQNEVPHRQRITAAEPIAVVIAMSPKLRSSCLQFHDATFWEDSEILTSK